MAERGFAERTDKRMIGYCYACKKPLKWHANYIDYSTILGARPVWICKNRHESMMERCLACDEQRPDDACRYVDESRSGYGWGMATRKPAREYQTGARIENEICGYVNPDYPGYPCIRKRGHDEESEFGVGHDHGHVPYRPPRKDPFEGYKEVEGVLRKVE